MKQIIEANYRSKLAEVQHDCRINSSWTNRLECGGENQGQSDIPLNDEGRRQALMLAERLQRESGERPWDFIITSGLSRAQETGAIIAEILQIPVYDPDSRLMERAFGQIEGLTSEERRPFGVKIGTCWTWAWRRG